MTKSKEEFLDQYERLLTREKEKLIKVPFWKFRESRTLRNNIRSLQYHINKINNPHK